MLITTTLLTGERTVVEVPDARELTPPVRTGVLVLDGTELEVNLGTAEAAEFFVASTGSALTGTLTLRSGQEMRTGSLGGGTGLVYLVDLGDEALFGPAPPGLGLEGLAAVLSDASITRTPDGASLSPRGALGWSPYRTHDLVLSVLTQADERYVLDVRRAFDLGPEEQRSQGVAVEGGLLTRSDPADNLHVVLEAPAHVAYGIPLPATDLDALVASMSRVRVSLG